MSSSSSCSSSRRRRRKVQIATTSLRRLRLRRSESVPSASMNARCSSSLATSSATPAPLWASVLMIGTRQPRCGASDRTPRGISRTIVSASGWSALLTTMMSGISMTPAFSAWIESPEPGIKDQDDGVGVVDDVDLGLADADGLQQDVVLAGGVHQQGGLQRGLAEPAQGAAVGHRADEDAGVEEVVGQADAVAEQRAVGERRGRVDRQDGDLALLLAAQLGQRADQRRLARAGRAGEADDRRPARVRVDLADESQPAGSSLSTSVIARARARLSPSRRRWARVCWACDMDRA